MENIIKDTTENLKNGTITKDEADKILLDLFGVIQRLENRITKLKEDYKNLHEKKEYEKGRVIVPMSISRDTRDFYNYTYDRLLKELEDILNVV